jgi:transglutaminase-like putative cysteine protease
VQVVHSVDVPARRDLLFSLAASAILLAVAGAQAIDSSFAVFVVVWIGALVTGLTLSWRSMIGGGGAPPVGTVVGSLVVVTIGAGLVLTLLPAPVAERGLTLPASLSSFVSLTDPGALVGGSSGTQPAQPGTPGGATGVGGYLGFAEPLDTALRGTLGDQVVFHVRATAPGYFLGATYDHWDGESWTSSPDLRGTTVLDGGSPFSIPAETGGGGGAGPVNVQTFYVAVPLPNLIFATQEPDQVWFPDRRLYVGSDGSIRSAVAITPGTVYTVISADDQVAPAALAGESLPHPVPAALTAYLQLPVDSSGRIRALATSITAGRKTVLGKVDALEAWMASHVRYSTDIPPLPRGEDAVDQFLFQTRVGFCEQISTALAVMLRTLGVPAREAIGYVPDAYDPLTNLWDVEAKDAHAWVQVWFPNHGWQSFDPTADVPLAAPDPGAVLAKDAWRALSGLPWPVIGPVGAVCVTEEALRRRWRRRPRTWAERAARRLESAGARAGVVRRRHETLAEYGIRLQQATVEGTERGSVRTAVAVLERAAYGAGPPGREARVEAEEAARRGAHAIGGHRIARFLRQGSHRS